VSSIKLRNFLSDLFGWRERAIEWQRIAEHRLRMIREKDQEIAALYKELTTNEGEGE